MSIYTPPNLNAVNFDLTAHTAADITSPATALTAYTVPALAAVSFALTAYTLPDWPAIGWELLPDLSFPTQYPGLRVFAGTVQELCLVALADAPPGDQWRIRKNGTDFAVYLVDPADPAASPVRIGTGDGTKAARLKT